MTTVNVQFSDSSESTIISYFSSPQDPEVWPNTGTVETTDARWKTYYEAQSPNIQPYLPSPS